VFNATISIRFVHLGFHIFPLFKSSIPERPWIESKGWNRFQGGLPSDGRIVPEKGELPATTDEKLISSWANNAATIGYGICAPFHIIFDLDVKNGKDGVRSFQELKTRYQVPNPSIIVKTKSGGLHLFYDREKDFIPSRVAKATNLKIGNQEFEGVDLIANSGYVVGPNSEGPISEWREGQYVLVKSRFDALTICPVELYRGQIKSNAAERVAAKPTTAEELISNEWEGDEDESVRLIKQGKVPDKIPTGRRDSLLTSLIGILKARRLPKDTVRILCEKFIANCELAIGETREAFAASVNLESKLNRFYAIQGDANDPRVVARELIDVGKVYKLVDQLHGAVAIISMADNAYITPRVIYTETKARQDLASYARPIPDSDSKRAVNPFDILLRDSSLPKVNCTGYFPKPITTYFDPADGSERVNMYLPPVVPIGASIRTDIISRYQDLVYELCGDMSDYFLDFMAHIVQKPWIKAGTGLLIISHAHGSGKNTIVQVMKPLIGPKNYLPVSGLGPLVEDKSVILEGNILVVFNEVARPANRSAWTDMARAVNKLKTAITESSSQINPKYEKQRTITTYSNFVMLSNDDCPYDLDPGDRRIAVINNDPPKLDQDKYGLVADFAHNEKNSRLSPREYENMVYEFHEFFSSRKIQHNIPTGDAPMGEAKKLMLQLLVSPLAMALRNYREAQGAGARGRYITDEIIIYLLRYKLGFKEFGGRERARFDIFSQFVESSVIHRVGQKGNRRKSRVVMQVPKLADREDVPLLGPIQTSDSASTVFAWNDVGRDTHLASDSVIRDDIWAQANTLRDPTIGKKDVLSLIK
jgi:Bifunctional DNA primase/polymerase, N-terminal/Family of unknown function (DUF5906)